MAYEKATIRSVLWNKLSDRLGLVYVGRSGCRRALGFHRPSPPREAGRASTVTLSGWESGLQLPWRIALSHFQLTNDTRKLSKSASTPLTALRDRPAL